MEKNDRQKSGKVYLLAFYYENCSPHTPADRPADSADWPGDRPADRPTDRPADPNFLSARPPAKTPAQPAKMSAKIVAPIGKSVGKNIGNNGRKNMGSDPHRQPRQKYWPASAEIFIKILTHIGNIFASVVKNVSKNIGFGWPKFSHSEESLNWLERTKLLANLKPVRVG